MYPRHTILAPALCLAWALLSATAQEPAPPAENAPIEKPAVEKKAEPAPLPDWSVRRKEFVHQLFGLQAAVETLPGTAFDMARNSPHEWGRTWGGLAKRYGSQYAQFLISESIEFGVSAIHHEDPRYFRLGPDASIGRRAWHAIRSTWVARDANGGGDKIAAGRIAGVYGAYYIASRWSPDSLHGAKPLLIWGSFGMATKSGANALREFWPDVKKRFRR